MLMRESQVNCLLGLANPHIPDHFADLYIFRVGTGFFLHVSYTQCLIFTVHPTSRALDAVSSEIIHQTNVGKIEPAVTYSEVKHVTW